MLSSTTLPGPLALGLLGLLAAAAAVAAADDAPDPEVTQTWHAHSSDEAVPIGGERLTNVTLRNPSHTTSVEITSLEVELFNGWGIPVRLVPVMPASWFSLVGGGGGPIALQPGASELVQVAFRPEAALGGALPRLALTGRLGGERETRRLVTNDPSAEFLTYPTHVSVSVSVLGQDDDPSSYSVGGVAGAVEEACPGTLGDDEYCIRIDRDVSGMTVHGDSVQDGQIESTATGPVTFFPAGGGAPEDAPASVIQPYGFLKGGLTNKNKWISQNAFTFSPGGDDSKFGRYESTLTVRTNSTLNSTLVFPVEATLRPGTVVQVKNVRLGAKNGARIDNTAVVYNWTQLDDSEDNSLNVSDPHAFTAGTSGLVDFQFEIESRASNPNYGFTATDAEWRHLGDELPCQNARDQYLTAEVSGSAALSPGDKVLIKGTFDAKGCVMYGLENGFLTLDSDSTADEFNATLHAYVKFDTNFYAYLGSFDLGMRVLSSLDYERELEQQRADDDDSGLSGGAVAAIVIGLLAGVGVAVFAFAQHQRQKKAGAAQLNDEEAGATYTAMH